MEDIYITDDCDIFRSILYVTTNVRKFYLLRFYRVQTFLSAYTLIYIEIFCVRANFTKTTATSRNTPHKPRYKLQSPH